MAHERRREVVTVSVKSMRIESALWDVRRYKRHYTLGGLVYTICLTSLFEEHLLVVC